MPGCRNSGVSAGGLLLRDHAVPLYTPNRAAEPFRSKAGALENPCSQCVRKHVLSTANWSSQRLSPGALGTLPAADASIAECFLLTSPIKLILITQWYLPVAERTSYIHPSRASFYGNLLLFLSFLALLSSLLGLEHTKLATTPGPLH